MHSIGVFDDSDLAMMRWQVQDGFAGDRNREDSFVSAASWSAAWAWRSGHCSVWEHESCVKCIHDLDCARPKHNLGDPSLHREQWLCSYLC